MLKSISYSVTFPSTGRVLSEDVVFQKGFGIISGANEAGKSFIFEMIRFALFGSAALRGNVSTYKKLSVLLDFSLKGIDYQIKRTTTGATLYENEKEIAVGTRPVNDKVGSLLGFGLDVFDMACVANQDALLALGDMRSSDRRRIVDSVIGLSVLDDLTKDLTNEAATLNASVRALKDNIQQPVEPKPYDGWQPSVELSQKMDEYVELDREYQQLKGWLARPLVEPMQPVNPHGLTSAELTAMIEPINALRMRRRDIERQIMSIPPKSPYDDMELDSFEDHAYRYDQFMEKQRFLARHQKPQASVEDLDLMEQSWIAYDRQQEFVRLNEQITHLLDHGQNECPSCHHRWPLEANTIEKLRAQRDALEPLSRTYNRPKLTRQEIAVNRKFHGTWDQEGWNQVADYPDHVVLPAVSTEQVRRYREANDKDEQRTRFQADIDYLNQLIVDAGDLEGKLRDVLRYEAQIEVYEGQYIEYNDWKFLFNQNCERMIELDKKLDYMDELKFELEESMAYENEFTSYLSANRAYLQAMENVRGMEARVEELLRGRKGLSELRGKIKQHLVPSLNKVASSLLFQMTGGDRQQIVVDEDFNILVDGQALETLSGSGKAIANLAIRLGLGQVLTNNVFSLFMGDEIDGSFDSNRTAHTANMFQSLRSRINQILMITHKNVSADYEISVGSSRQDVD